jgi:predicted NUDIX family NTP pyrophosphohydrolase
MPKQSAGILLYKVIQKKLFVFLAHPGGPFYAKKDNGVWSIPKGEFNESEHPFDVAKREFYEEVGTEIQGQFLDLLPVKLKSGKKIFAWACEGELDSKTLRSNTFEIEWPPKSGKLQSFPEIDKGEWFSIADAKVKINEGQIPLLNQLAELLNYSSPEKPDSPNSQLSLF